MLMHGQCEISKCICDKTLKAVCARWGPQPEVTKTWGAAAIPGLLQEHTVPLI